MERKMDVPRGSRWPVLLTGLALVGWPAPVPAASPGITVTEESVSLSLEPSGRVAVVGLMRRSHGRIPGFERWEGVLVDDDGDGAVEVVLERPANPAMSLWVAVDLGSGEWVTAGPTAGPAGTARLLPAGSDVAAGASLWPVPVGILEVLMVRPGVGEAAGAWGGSVWDGGAADGDGLADGSAGVAPGTLRPIGEGAAAPARFAAGDVLVAIEPVGFRFTITKVVAGAGEAGEASR